MEKHSLAHHILMYLKETSKDALEIGTMMIFEPRKFKREYGVGSLYKDYNRTSRYHSNYDIKRSPYFIVKNDTFYVSDKGRIKIIKSIIEDKKKVKKWDGKWRAIIFDVPEIKRKQRDFLRRELKWMGFKELQHSIWITPYDTEKELLCLLKLWKSDFTGDIRFLLVEKMIDDQDVKELFSTQSSRS